VTVTTFSAARAILYYSINTDRFIVGECNTPGSGDLDGDGGGVLFGGDGEDEGRGDRGDGEELHFDWSVVWEVVLREEECLMIVDR
jgi:hypothetical protein